MSPARWRFCHQVMVDAERRQIKRLARLLGNDLALFSSSAAGKDQEDSWGPVRAYPLAAMLNPEAFNRLASQDIDIEDNRIPDDQYEAQLRAMESGGLTDLDVLSTKLDARAKELKREKLPSGIVEWDPVPGQAPPTAAKLFAPVAKDRANVGAPSAPGRRPRLRLRRGD